MTGTGILDNCQTRLHDPSNKIWARRELLDYLNEGRRELQTLASSGVTWSANESPGRWGYGAAFTWERETVRPARAWLPFFDDQVGSYQVAFRWELEQLAGLSPQNSGNALTQPWELAYASTDRPLPFPMPEDMTRAYRIAWNGTQLYGATVKQFDSFRYSWFTDTGLPQYQWTDGLGPKQFGIFPLHAGYNQEFTLLEASGAGNSAPLGTPRIWSGTDENAFGQYEDIVQAEAHTCPGDAANTHGLSWMFAKAGVDDSTYNVTQPWEKDATLPAGLKVGCFWWEPEYGAANFPAGFAGLGTVRQVDGSRQYVPSAVYGLARWWGYQLGVSLIYARLPDQSPFDGDGTSVSSPLSELHPRLHKYVRSFVMWRALTRAGPGQDAALGAYYQSHFKIGLEVLKRISWATSRDLVPVRRDFTPELVQRSGRPGRVQLPPTFPRVIV